jgi:hypothetical protein
MGFIILYHERPANNNQNRTTNFTRLRERSNTNLKELMRFPELSVISTDSTTGKLCPDPENRKIG